MLAPGLVIALELYLLRQRRTTRFSALAFTFVIPAAIFIAIWLGIPKPISPLELGLHPLEALYLSQGLSFPIAHLISQTGGWELSPVAQALLALVLSLAALAALCPRPARPALVLTLVWWVCASSLAWVARTIYYLEVAPRVFYFPSFDAALAWAVVIAGACHTTAPRRLPGYCGHVRPRLRATIHCL